MEDIFKVLSTLYPEIFAGIGLIFFMYSLLWLNKKAKNSEYKDIIELFTFLLIFFSFMTLFLVIFRIVLKLFPENNSHS